MKILAVDDDVMILELLSEALTASGFMDTVLVSSSTDALPQIADRQKKFDCFLLDIQMPGINGIDLCAKIRQTAGYSQTPIIMVTAMSDKSYVERAFSAGATDYVTKPFDILELGTRLRLAKKLNDERRLANDSICAVATLTKQMNANLAHNLNEPVEIRNVERAIGYLAFEDYLLRLTRGSLFFSSVFALKVANIEALHASLSPAVFRTALDAIAKTMSDKLKFANSFLSYRGNGLFVCVCHRGSMIERADFEFSIQDSTNQKQFVDASGKPIDIDIVLGNPVSPGAFARPGSLGFLISAIDNAEQRAMDQRNAPQELKSLDEATREKRQQSYESLLSESLVDGFLPLKKTSGKALPDFKVA